MRITFKNEKHKKIAGIVFGIIFVGLYLFSYLNPKEKDSATITEYVEEYQYQTTDESVEGAYWDVEETVYYFRSEELLNQHFEKHGEEFDYASAEEYEAGAGKVINNPNSLQKVEQEDGDYIFYLEGTNEFVILSKDGYIRTYFKPSDGIDYFNRQ